MEDFPIFKLETSNTFLNGVKLIKHLENSYTGSQNIHNQ